MTSLAVDSDNEVLLSVRGNEVKKWHTRVRFIAHCRCSGCHRLWLLRSIVDDDGLAPSADVGVASPLSLLLTSSDRETQRADSHRLLCQAES